MTAALVACIISFLGLLLLMAAGPIYRTGLVPLQAAFALLMGAAVCGIAGMAVSAITGAVTYWRGGGKLTLVVAIAAFAVGLVAFAIPYQWQSTARRVPPIHAITTDLENPPAFDAVLPLRAHAQNAVE